MDYYYTKGILTYFLKKVLKQALARPEIVLSISSGLSSVARHALIDAVMHAGAQKAFLLPVAVAAVGTGNPPGYPGCGSVYEYRAGCD